MDKLQEEFPADWSDRVERLSEYIASTGKKYKNHLATIRSWARKDADQKPIAVKKGVPMGGTGELGDAEMAAIRKMMSL